MVDKINLAISLEGHRSNGWPLIQVEFNDQILWNQPVMGSKQLDYSNIDARENNRLIIKHHGKKDDSCVAGQDRWCDLNWFSINDNRFDINFLSTHKIMYLCDDGEKLVTSYLGKNGRLIFDFPWPLWHFWYQCQNL